ncbi:MAG TPA: protein kinase [Trichormus sp.]|jgi:serine/threonine protein kinase
MTAPGGDFGDYEIISEIGRGGMGIVYQARDKRDNRIVAIKQLVFSNIDPAKEQEFRDRFRREAATAARLTHPNIVTVYDVCVDQQTDKYFYVMEFLEGHNLRRELDIRGGRLSPKEWWPVFEQVVEGLSFAHSRNVVHRDVKPDNIFLLKDGTVKITDFGIARTADYEQTQLTKTGVMMGTLAYVSPEQLQDAKNVDHRADIFSLGVVSYEALSSEVPFTGDGIAQTIVKIVSQEETPLHILLPFIDVHVSAAISKALRKRARERYRTIKDFSKEYEQALEEADRLPQQPTGEQKTVAPPSSPPTRVSQAPIRQSTGPQEMSMLERIKAQGIDTLRAGGGGEPTSVDSKPTTRGSTPAAKSDYMPIRPLHMFDTHGKHQTKLVEPAVLCYRSGRLAVADTSTRKIHLYTYDGRWVGDCTFRDSQDSRTRGGNLTKPSGLAIDLRGRIYASDSSDPYVRIYDSRGVFMKEICNIQGKDGGIQGIALDSTGLLFISDMPNACIQVFQADLGLWMRKLAAKPGSEGAFQLPSGLASDRINQIYCVDYGTSKIVIFNKSGVYVRSFGGKGTAHGLFNVPRAVAVDNNDKIYVLDSLNHRIQIFGPTGEWFSSFGGRGSDPGKFVGPSDFSIDPANNLMYVADKGNQRIQVFEICQS